MNKLELMKTANEVRKGIVTAVHSAKSGHPGGSLSAADIFTYLYFEEMNIDPKDPKKADRDRFVLSKGHTAPGLYSTLANRGYFPVEAACILGFCAAIFTSRYLYLHSMIQRVDFPVHPFPELHPPAVLIIIPSPAHPGPPRRWSCRPLHREPCLWP